MKTVKPSSNSNISISETFPPAPTFEKLKDLVESGKLSKYNDTLVIVQQPQLFCAYLNEKNIVKVDIKDEKKLLSEIQKIKRPENWNQGNRVPSEYNQSILDQLIAPETKSELQFKKK